MKSLNREILRALSYHESTKHTFESVRTNPHFLDWDHQPNPFRFYEGAPPVKLPSDPQIPPAPALEILHKHTHYPPFQQSRDALLSQCPTPQQGIPLISSLMWHSMAISAWKQIRGTDVRYSLRVNPSSGNLHPTETHLLVNGFEDLPDGVYHYFVLQHALEFRRSGCTVAALAHLLRKPWIVSCPAIAVLSSIFCRESWKYRSRAYRYCNLDVGHAAGSILVAARALGLDGSLIGNFPDEPVADLIGIGGTDEAPMLILPLWSPHAGSQVQGVGDLPGHKRAAPQTNLKMEDEDVCPTQTSLSSTMGTANTLSTEVVTYPLIDAVHHSTLLLEVDEPALIAVSSQPDRTPAPFEHPRINLPSVTPTSESLSTVVRRRRSALNYDPQKGNIVFEHFSALMLAAQAEFGADWKMNLLETAPSPERGMPKGHDWIRLYLYVHRVEGLDPGLYLYHPNLHALEQYAKGNIQRAAAYLSLEQSLAGNSCVTFSMVADLDTALKTFGNRGYRYCHTEAGFIGQQIYLAAEALGFNATGIGAFYDDDVHEFLQIGPDRGQVVYHFSVGYAVHDDRLVADDVIHIAQDTSHIDRP
jgi:SagB-type dehydrogenase family enzyme